MTAVTSEDERKAARRRLPHMLFEYLDGGAFDELTLAANMAELRELKLRQRVLRDVGSIETGACWFGHPVRLPVALGPIGFAGMFARRGEAQAARAATQAGLPFCLSTVGICPVEEVAAAAAPAMPWFQLYMIRDRGFMQTLLDRVAAVGISVLVFTVDLPVAGTRYRDIRSGMNRPGGVGWIGRMAQIARHPGWAIDVGIAGRPLVFGNLVGALSGKESIDALLPWIVQNMDPTVTWADLQWLRKAWRGQILLKGILDADDAELGIQHGADAIIVSNHGGRQLDGAPATIRVLPGIAERVAGRAMLLADGGIRSGADILRFLAAGAQGCLLGRAWAYALAADGEDGVARMLARLDTELRVAMALTGLNDVSRASTHNIAFS